jgi:hypothetical protein
MKKIISIMIVFALTLTPLSLSLDLEPLIAKGESKNNLHWESNFNASDNNTYIETISIRSDDLVVRNKNGDIIIDSKQLEINDSLLKGKGNLILSDKDNKGKKRVDSSYTLESVTVSFQFLDKETGKILKVKKAKEKLKEKKDKEKSKTSVLEFKKNNAFAYDPGADGMGSNYVMEGNPESDTRINMTSTIYTYYKYNSDRSLKRQKIVGIHEWTNPVGGIDQNRWDDKKDFVYLGWVIGAVPMSDPSRYISVRYENMYNGNKTYLDKNGLERHTQYDDANSLAYYVYEEHPDKVAQHMVDRIYMEVETSEFRTDTIGYDVEAETGYVHGYYDVSYSIKMAFSSSGLSVSVDTTYEEKIEQTNAYTTYSTTEVPRN